MATIIQGNRDVFNTLSGFAMPSDRDYEFMSSTSERFRSTVTRSADDFFERTRQTYRRVDRDELVRMAKAAVGNSISHWSSYDVHTLSTVTEFQNAPDCMLAAMMAMPTLRKMYLKQRVDGYSGRYENVHGNRVGHNHRDYQKVMSGIWHEDQQGEMTCTIYDSDIEDPSFVHGLRETGHIRRSWEYLESMLDDGMDDPTSRYNAKL